MSARRRTLVADLQRGLCDLRDKREWWRKAVSLLLGYRGRDEAEAIGLGRAAAEHFNWFCGMIDQGLDLLAEVLNPQISDAALWSNPARRRQGSELALFQARTQQLGRRIFKWWHEHVPPA